MHVCLLSELESELLLNEYPVASQTNNNYRQQSINTYSITHIEYALVLSAAPTAQQLCV